MSGDPDDKFWLKTKLTGASRQDLLQTVMLSFGVSMEKGGHDLYFVLPANTFCGKILFMALGTNIRAFRASIRRRWPIVDAGSGVGPNYIGACRCSPTPSRVLMPHRCMEMASRISPAPTLG